MRLCSMEVVVSSLTWVTPPARPQILVDALSVAYQKRHELKNKSVYPLPHPDIMYALN